MTNDRRFELTRRKALAGLGTVGVASAGAGLGTSAFLTDTESFTGNTLSAGELDLKVAWEEAYNYAGADTTLENTGTSGCGDVTAAAEINLGDVKPGDEGSVEFEFQLCNNPGYLWMFGNLISQSEGGVTEPEGDADAEQGQTAFNRPIVELLDAVEVTLSYTGGETIFDTTLRNALRKMRGEFGRGIYGLPLDGDRSTNYDEYQRAAGARAATDAFTDDGVNVFYDFETNNDYKATIESAEDPSSSTNRGEVAHATSFGDATSDYVTSAIGLGGISLSSLDKLYYEYYEGANNENAAPDEVYLQITDSNGASHLVYLTLNDDALNRNSQQWHKRDVYAEIQGSDSVTRSWIEINDDGSTTTLSDDLTQSYSSFDIETVAVGRGSTRTQRVLDVYYDFLYSEGSSGSTTSFSAQDPFPTVDTEYAGTLTGDRNPFAANTVESVTLDWRIPSDVGNEIQSDSVTFDLGFYTEQARHNNGSGA